MRDGSLHAAQILHAYPLQRLARVFALGASAAAAAVLFGWLLDIAALKSITPSWPAMKANTAICFLLCGASFWLYSREPRPTSSGRFTVAATLALVAAAIALATLAEYAFAVNLGIDELLFRDTRDLTNPLPAGRMSPYAAVSFVLVAAGLVTSRGGRTNALRDVVTMLPVLVIALLSIISYLFGVPAHSLAGSTGLAFLTSLCFFSLGIAVLALRGNGGPLGIFNDRSDGGELARRLLPWIIVAPIVVAWMRLQGERAGIYSTEFGLALHTTANVAVLTFLVWISTRSLAATDAARRQATGELSSTENRWRALIEHGSEGISLLDRDGSIFYRSPSAARLLGREPSEPTRAFLYSESLHPDDAHALKAKLDALRLEPGGVAQSIDRFKHGDGTWHWIESTLTNLLDDPDVAATVVNFRDVTERRKSEDALRESEERFREIAGHIHEAFFSVDLTTGRTLYISPAWAKIWGRPVADAYANPNMWFESVHPDDRAALIAGQEAVKRGETRTHVFRVTRPDGTMRWVRGRAFPVRNSAGHIHRMVGTSEDITELRSTEEQFVQAQKMEAVGRLAGGVAHDFNNLLTIILAEADMARADLPPDSPVAAVFGDIRRAGESAAVLTRQLLAFSRKQLVEPVVFDLNDAVADTVKLLRRLIGEDLRVELRLAPHAGSVRADRGQFEQVLTNLAVNARDAMPTGGLLGIETSVAVFDDAYAASHADVVAGDYAVVIVSDTGSGMTDEVLARAFEPFFTTKESGKGTGLGLATCYGIVKQAGGHIAVYSERGAGTTFRVYFPMVSAAAVNAGVAEQQAPPRGTEVVLLVEDDHGVRRVGARLLRTQGYAVLEARDGLEALNVLHAHPAPIDLLLTDVVLPGMGGREVAERVRQLRPGIKVLYTSGYTDDVILQHQLLSHDVTVLQKPYTRSSLAAKVREVLDG